MMMQAVKPACIIFLRAIFFGVIFGEAILTN
jgi:hypothetical protein